MTRIFISYRRSDSKDVAGRIYDRLTEYFDRDDVFKDVDSICAGQVFPNVLADTLEQCEIVLVLIGDTWLDVMAIDGRRRLDDPGDFVRLEIETALKRRVLVIPLLVGQTLMPEREKLPVSLRDLTHRHARSIRPDPDFHRDMDLLLQDLGVDTRGINSQRFKSKRLKSKEEDDAPRGKNKKHNRAGLSPPMLGGIVLGGLLLLGGVGYGVYSWSVMKSGGESGSTSNAPVPTGWVEYKPAGGEFKAYFPTSPKLDMSGAGFIKIYDGEDIPSKSGCIVIMHVSPDVILPENRKGSMNDLIETILELSKAKEMSRKDATLAGFAATEIVAEVPQKKTPQGAANGVQFQVFRVIATDTRIFCAGVYSDNRMPKPELMNGFFDNFKLAN